MRDVLHWVINGALILLATVGVVEIAVFCGAAFLARAEFDFDDERDWQ